MFAAFLILMLLICASPITLFMEGNLAIGIEAALMSLALGLIARKSASAETEQFEFSLLVFALASIPALWMIIQALPLGYLANPVWESAQQALGSTIVGSIGIDTGAGMLGLIQYLATIAILYVTMEVAFDRSRADQILFALLVGCTLICLPIPEILPRLNIRTGAGLDDAVAVRNVSVIGVLLAITAIIRAFERKQSSRVFSQSDFIVSVAGGIITLSVCGSALAVQWTANLGFGLTLAMIVLLAMTLIRRFEIANWGIAAIAAVIVTTSASALWINNSGRTVDLMLTYSDHDGLNSVTNRILADAPWVGSGTGSFQTLASIYREPGDESGPAIASTAAAKVAIELGPPMLWAAIVFILFGIAALLQGALRRGRDSFYPALGACCLIALLIRAFGDAGIFTPAVSIIAAATVGLSLGQRRGRTTLQYV